PRSDPGPLCVPPPRKSPYAPLTQTGERVMVRAALIALLAAPLLSGCLIIARDGSTTTSVMSIVDTSGMPGEMEPIHAAAFTADSALFQVSSNGCTDREDIQPIVSRVDDEVVVTLRRLTP